MQCSDCQYYEKGFVHSRVGGTDFGMRNYGVGLCGKYGYAVWGSDKGCGKNLDCYSCARHKEVFLQGDSNYIDSMHIVCMIWKTDVSRKEKKCPLYLPEESYNSCGSTHGGNPKFGRLVPEMFLLWFAGVSRQMRLFRRRRKL